jgi:hypothetical protein
MFVKYAFIAESAHLDEKGNTHAVAIFDTILTPGFPALRRDMTLVAQLEGTASEAGDHRITVELRDEDANKLAEMALPLALGSSKLLHGIFRSGVILQMHDLVFKKAGHYEFVMFVDQRFLGRVTFAVQKVQAKET